ncbi:NAD+ synthetase [Nitzschia inconspicua]|uniref:Glutamine-dependent NAD(+) synthetase n=1 Tax=Nitzschia inconspicua TaxID=303405 RepID=A0A9K3PP96_9STRA|nr:NAD+ synthetase [Nitzschia inconspicua]
MDLLGSTSIVTVATCTLNQWALDFDGNLERILQSCQKAKEQGATYRLGPELEITGYGCEDHFLELDTILHSWQSMVELLCSTATENLLCDFGMPLLHKGCRYNCRILCFNHQILAIRPKNALADDGNYREPRYFTAFKGGSKPDSFSIPSWVLDELSSKGCENHPPHVPFGNVFLQTFDGVQVGCESCEELWTPKSPHIDMSLQSGVEIIGNGSGSHHNLRKLENRLELMMSATRKCGGLYLYSNQRGCDGAARLYFDGGAIIVCNGKLLAQAPQFSLEEVTVISATVDLDDVRSYRAHIPSFGVQAIREQSEDTGTHYTTVRVPQARILLPRGHARGVSDTIPLALSTPEEECCLGPACWLWDYLRRSGASGYLLPLSGGADSSAVATIVGAMCHLVYDEVTQKSNAEVFKDLKRICHISEEQQKSWKPSSPQEIANHILHTVFMGTENSSNVTTSRAKRLGAAIGSYHLTVPIDLMVKAVIQVFTITTKLTPHFQIHGGTMAEDLALQNIQARLRMVTAYLFAQLLPWTRSRKGFLLVLGSANVDEGLRGYMTKYDCSSADLNPIGAISKGDLKRMLAWAGDRYKHEVLKEIAGAPPTAELRPNASTKGEGGNDDAEHSQLDEDEMGMTYEELGWFGRLRKIGRCGPVSMYNKLVHIWKETCTPSEVGAKVKRFFYYYSVNRHKMCTLTPSYHAEANSPDDNRFDLRPFLYNTKWPRQFSTIDRMVQKDEEQLCK